MEPPRRSTTEHQHHNHRHHNDELWNLLPIDAPDIIPLLESGSLRIGVSFDTTKFHGQSLSFLELILLTPEYFKINSVSA